MKKTVDVAIVGGGLVGLSFALLLARQTSLTVAIIESNDSEPAWSESSYHHRVSAFSPASLELFHALGIWDELVSRRVSPFDAIEVWEESIDEAIQFDGESLGLNHLGCIIENNLVQSQLAIALSKEERVTWFRGVRLKAYAETEHEVILEGESGEMICASLAVAADGAASWLRQASGIAVSAKSYAQSALVAMIRTEHSHGKIARQRFLNTGPLGMLPLVDDHLISIVWTLPEEMCLKMRDLSDADFLTQFKRASQSVLGDPITTSSRFLFPLRRQLSEAYVKSRVVLMGDAAHTVHPLAGQGVNLGLADVSCLGQLIRDALSSSRRFDSPRLLRRYERMRQAENAPLLLAIDGVKTGYAANQWVFTLCRHLGLQTLRRFPWLKTPFVQHAAGLMG